MLTLSQPEMLARWRTHRGYISTVEGYSLGLSPELDTLHLAQIEAWYSRLLAEGPESLFDPVDYASNTILSSAAGGQGVTFSLPKGAVRLLRVRLRGWLCDARIISDPECQEARWQADSFTRASADAPVAVIHPGGFVSLYPAMPENIPETILCAARHPDGLYHFEPQALEWSQS